MLHVILFSPQRLFKQQYLIFIIDATYVEQRVRRFILATDHCYYCTVFNLLMLQPNAKHYPALTAYQVYLVTLISLKTNTVTIQNQPLPDAQRQCLYTLILKTIVVSIECSDCSRCSV